MVHVVIAPGDRYAAAGKGVWNLLSIISRVHRIFRTKRVGLVLADLPLRKSIFAARERRLAKRGPITIHLHHFLHGVQKPPPRLSQVRADKNRAVEFPLRFSERSHELLDLDERSESPNHRGVKSFAAPVEHRHPQGKPEMIRIGDAQIRGEGEVRRDRIPPRVFSRLVKRSWEAGPPGQACLEQGPVSQFDSAESLRERADDEEIALSRARELNPVRMQVPYQVDNEVVFVARKLAERGDFQLSFHFSGL